MGKTNNHSKTATKNCRKKQITLIYFESKQRYGIPRVTLELHSFGYKISRITVAKYMKQLGLRSKLSKKFKVTTWSLLRFIRQHPHENNDVSFITV